MAAAPVSEPNYQFHGPDLAPLSEDRLS